MLPFEDIAFQLINLPPISAERIELWMAELLLSADAVWLVVDLADPAGSSRRRRRRRRAACEVSR